ncbi:MAG: minor capsid protein [Parvibaculaceae bacterium]|nr:minor capsid protein [Parvibaculaceae bacterium]
MASVNEDVFDRQVSHQIYLQRYTSQVIKKIVALLSKIDSRLAAELERVDLTTVKQARLDKLLESVRDINAEAYGAVGKELKAELKGFAAYEAEFQERILLESIPVNVDYVRPAPNQLYAAVSARPFQGRLLKEWLRDVEANTFRRVRDEIRMGFVEGRTTDQMVRDLRGTAKNKYSDGIIARGKRETYAIVRTAVSHTASVAREMSYAENETIIKGVKWISTLDSRTSAICQARDGKIYKPSKGPRPPAHVNCRSATTPIVKSWAEMGISLKEAPAGTRASINGQVPEDMTYGQWLKRQPIEVQEDVLGVAKAKLFRDGGVGVDRFVDTSGHEYTLDELRSRDAEAFKRAGL